MHTSCMYMYNVKLDPNFPSRARRGPFALAGRAVRKDPIEPLRAIRVKFPPGGERELSMRK